MAKLGAIIAHRPNDLMVIAMLFETEVDAVNYLQANLGPPHFTHNAKPGWECYKLVDEDDINDSNSRIYKVFKSYYGGCGDAWLDTAEVELGTVLTSWDLD
jgi:hypothetical protein